MKEAIIGLLNQGNMKMKLTWYVNQTTLLYLRTNLNTMRSCDPKDTQFEPLLAFWDKLRVIYQTQEEDEE